MENLNTIVTRIREDRPLIHCITNEVTVNDCANALLSLGASPTMAHHPAEVMEVTGAADALVCNMGAVNYFDAMEAAAMEAERLGHVIVLDPVGVAGSSFRRRLALELIEKCPPTCIRGNYSEIRALMENRSTGAGVDAKDSKIDIDVMKSYAKLWQCIVVASGKIDIITDGEKVFTCDRGHEMMSRITGSGCISSCLLGAFLSAENSLESALSCVTLMGICGERAAKKCEMIQGGNMTFRTLLLDEIYQWKI